MVLAMILKADCGLIWVESQLRKLSWLRKQLFFLSDVYLVANAFIWEKFASALSSNPTWAARAYRKKREMRECLSRNCTRRVIKIKRNRWEAHNLKPSNFFAVAPLPEETKLTAPRPSAQSKYASMSAALRAQWAPANVRAAPRTHLVRALNHQQLFFCAFWPHTDFFSFVWAFFGLVCVLPFDSVDSVI